MNNKINKKNETPKKEWKRTDYRFQSLATRTRMASYWHSTHSRAVRRKIQKKKKKAKKKREISFVKKLIGAILTLENQNKLLQCSLEINQKRAKKNVKKVKKMKAAISGLSEALTYTEKELAFTEKKLAKSEQDCLELDEALIYADEQLEFYQ